MLSSQQLSGRLALTILISTLSSRTTASPSSSLNDVFIATQQSPSLYTVPELYTDKVCLSVLPLQRTITHYVSLQARVYPPTRLAARKVGDDDGLTPTGRSIGSTSSTSSSNSRSSPPPTGTSVVLPAIIAVVLFVVGTLIFLKIIRARHRVVPVYRIVTLPSEPEKPRMCEVSLREAPPEASSLAGKWSDLMVRPSPIRPCTRPQPHPLHLAQPVTVEKLPEDVYDARSSRRSSASSLTCVSSGRSPSRASRKSVAASSEDSFSMSEVSGIHRAQVAFVVTMPSERRPRNSFTSACDVPLESCIGLVDVSY